MPAEKRDFDEFLEKFKRHHDLMVEELHKVIIGQDAVIDQILAAIFTGGHCLLVGVPGLAKTLVVSTIAQILDAQFKRIQFTPDLMPSDITGTNVLDESDTGRREFRFVQGPVFTNILLADEINRTPPKTQAALLQSMQEREVTVGQQTYPLPEPFFVIATQNPIEQEGTYPLPEAQLDRFMFNVKVDYPTLEHEEEILSRTTTGEKPEVRKVLSSKSILYLEKQIRQIEATPLTINYVARLVRATRPPDSSSPEVHPRDGRLGGRSPRRAIPDCRRQGGRRHGRPAERFARGRAQSRRPRAAAPHLDELPVASRRTDARRHHQPADQGSAAADHSEVRRRAVGVREVR